MGIKLPSKSKKFTIPICILSSTRKWKLDPPLFTATRTPLMASPPSSPLKKLPESQVHAFIKYQEKYIFPLLKKKRKKRTKQNKTYIYMRGFQYIRI